MGKGKYNHQDQRQAKQRDRMAKQQFRRNKQKKAYGDASWKAAWLKFEEQLARLGLVIKDVAGDGNCLFRAIADQMEGDPNKHADYRRRIVDFLRANREDYEPFVEDDVPFDTYTNNMATNGEWGGNMEIQAASMMLSVNITIHQLEQPRWEISNFDPTSRTLHLSYHDGDHYASVRRRDDPLHRVGVPATIDLSATTRPGLSSAVAKKKPSWQEDSVMLATGCNNVKFVKTVLSQSNDDVDAAVDFIVTCGGATDEVFQAEFLADAGVYPSDDESTDKPWDVYTKKNSSPAPIPAYTSLPSGPTQPQGSEADEEDDESSGEENHHRNRRVERVGGKKGLPLRNHLHTGGNPKKKAPAEKPAFVHPKLAKWQNDKTSNKARQRQSKSDREAPTPKTPTQPAASSNQDIVQFDDGTIVDLGSLAI